MMKAILFLSAAISMTACSTISPCSKNMITRSASESVETKSTFCQNTAKSFECVKVVEVYDGDTIFIDLPDKNPLFGRTMGGKLLGIDTPEKRSKNAFEKKKAAEAQAVLEKILNKATSVDIWNVRKDKFFRILGEVVADGRPVIDDLIKLKLADTYLGELKSNPTLMMPLVRYSFISNPLVDSQNVSKKRI